MGDGAEKTEEGMRYMWNVLTVLALAAAAYATWCAWDLNKRWKAKFPGE